MSPQYCLSYVPLQLLAEFLWLFPRTTKKPNKTWVTQVFRPGVQPLASARRWLNSSGCSSEHPRSLKKLGSPSLCGGPRTSPNPNQGTGGRTCLQNLGDPSFGAGPASANISYLSAVLAPHPPRARVCSNHCQNLGDPSFERPGRPTGRPWAGPLISKLGSPKF